MRRNHDMLLPLKTRTLGLKCFMQAVLEMMCAGFPGISSRCESCESQARFREPQLRELHELPLTSRGAWSLLCQEFDELCSATPCWNQRSFCCGVQCSLWVPDPNMRLQNRRCQIWETLNCCWYKCETKCANGTGGFWLQFWSLNFSFSEKECLVLFYINLLFNFIISCYISFVFSNLC